MMIKKIMFFFQNQKTSVNKPFDVKTSVISMMLPRGPHFISKPFGIVKFTGFTGVIECHA